MARVDISPDVADVLRRSSVEGSVLRLPEGQLPRPLYAATDKVIRLLGGKWDRRARGHVFTIDPAAKLAEALDDGSVVNQKQALQFFETPVDLAARMAELLDPKPDTMVLEPSAGSGRLADAVFALDRGVWVVAVEKDPALKKGLLHRLNFTANIRVIEADFLEWECDGSYAGYPIEGVIMNPPFRGNQDIRHIRRAYSMLAPGGRLVAIASEHGFIGNEREAVDWRNWLSEHGADDAGLPRGTFKESGTDVAARLIVMRKGAE